ncbi:MAG: hypothetical protein NTX50_17570 [Candidatus Sumerlaeota bacterium]|nr:hypothetical protein [Candidatus Sumerlaeota bacterium]
MKTPFFDLLNKIDEILHKRPNAKDFENHLRPLLAEEAALRYFYEHISDPAWLDILAAAGEFSSLPKSEHNIWWPAECLKTMAKRAPEKVRDIIIKILPNCNSRIHNDIVEATRAMPPAVAASIVPYLIEWVHQTQRLQFPDDDALLVIHLAEGQEIEAALTIAQALLAISPSLRKPGEEESTALGSRKGPQALMDSYWYANVIEKLVPVLPKCAGLRALELFCALLQDAAKAMMHQGPDNVMYELVWDWPPAIEPHEQNNIHDSPKDLLVFAVRDISKELITEHGAKVLEIVEFHEYLIFKRIGLHLRRIWPDLDMVGTNALLSVPGIYSEPALHHERFHLLRAVFAGLAPETKAIFFQHVEQGRDTEVFRKNFFERHKREPTSKEIAKDLRLFQFRELIPVKDQLTGKWKQKFDELHHEFSIGECPDFLIYVTSGRVSPTLPLPQDKLASMTVEEITQYLRNFQPSENPMDDSLDALGLALKELIRPNPDKYLSRAELFLGLHPRIVHKFIFGIRMLIANKQQFNTAIWVPTLNLCKAILSQQPDLQIQESSNSNLNNNLEWIRSEIANVIGEGLKLGPSSIPIEFRQLSWSVLAPLTDDQDPSIERERDAVDLDIIAFNSVRGISINAVVQYALWLRRAMESLPDAAREIAEGFNSMPEVCDILEKHLDISKESSLAIRAVYGRYFPWLVLLDPGWAQSAKERIFPKEPNLGGYFDAAWTAYARFCQPYNNVLPVIRDEYGFAIQKIGTWSEEHRRPADPDECLMDHLMTFYWRGIIDLEDPLLCKAYDKAPVKLRGHAIEFIGISLQRTKDEDIERETILRIQKFWEWRLNAVRNSEDAALQSEEIINFGDWFTAGKFDDGWLMEQLQAVLEIASWAERNHLVVERLAELSNEFPGQAVKCLSMMVEGSQKRERWHIGAWRDEMRTILSTAIRIGAPDIRDSAIALVHQLGSLGFLQFRDLLPSKDAKEDS